MELRHLRYFVAVAEELHFHRAAERLMIAQPPLSQQIKALEQEMQVRLFRRTKRHVELTEAGQAFLGEARRALAQAELAVLSAQRAQRGEVGRLTVGFVGSATYTVLPPVLRAFRRSNPGVEVTVRELTTAEQLESLRDRHIDVGFVRTPGQHPHLAHAVLLEEDFVAALPDTHRRANSRRTLALRDLEADPFIVFPRRLAAGLYDRIVSACQQAGFSPRVILETTNTPVVISLVGAGLGVALVPACVQALRLKGVVYKAIREPRPKTNIVLAWRNDSDSAALRAFVRQAEKTVGR